MNRPCAGAIAAESPLLLQAAPSGRRHQAARRQPSGPVGLRTRTTSSACPHLKIPAQNEKRMARHQTPSTYGNHAHRGAVQRHATSARSSRANTVAAALRQAITTTSARRIDAPSAGAPRCWRCRRPARMPAECANELAHNKQKHTSHIINRPSFRPFQKKSGPRHEPHPLPR